MDQEEQYFKKRLIGLSKRAEEKNIVTFSNFLNLNELNILHQITKELYSSFQLSGGTDHAERQMVAFIPDALFFVREHPECLEFPIKAIRITPSHPKFAEELTHRDVLGALMNLGIKREMLGDILVLESGIIVLCVDSMSSYLAENCIRIRHTMVSCQEITAADIHYEPKLIEKAGIVSSFRLDTIIADVCKLTRSDAQKLIFEGNAFVNARKIQQNDYNCQNGDILSVRHFGKFQLEMTGSVTKKGRMKYIYKVYA